MRLKGNSDIYELAIPAALRVRDDEVRGSSCKAGLRDVGVKDKIGGRYDGS